MKTLGIVIEIELNETNLGQRFLELTRCRSIVKASTWLTPGRAHIDKHTSVWVFLHLGANDRRHIVARRCRDKLNNLG